MTIEMPNKRTDSSARLRPVAFERNRSREGQDPRSFDEVLPQQSEVPSEARTEPVQSSTWTRNPFPCRVFLDVVLVNRFRLIERLGAGGMGQVWRAVDQRLGREVAVKISSLRDCGNNHTASALERETFLLAQLNHPGIVTILDSDEDANHRFLVMELVEGVSFDQVIDRVATRAGVVGGTRNLEARDLLDAIGVDPVPGRAPVLSDENWYRAVAKIMVETLRTLEAAHARHIVHRDLKPANLMLTAGGHPVLLDFGLGGTIGGQPQEVSRGLSGTFRFIAPEQLTSKVVGSDVRTDIYQIGLVLYELLTLRKVFDVQDGSDLYSKITAGDFRLPRTVDPHMPIALENICLCAIELDRTRRYQTARSFREDLERFVSGKPPEVRDNRGLGKTARNPEVIRYRTPVAAIAATLVGFTAWWLWGP